MPINTSSITIPYQTLSYVTLNSGASIRGLEAFTFMAWFKVGPNSVNAPQQAAYVERQGGTGSKYIRFRFSPVKGKLQFGFSAKDMGMDTSYTYNTKWDDRWHHAAFSARVGSNRPSYQMFLDGVRVAEGTLIVPSGMESVQDTAPAAITIGNHIAAVGGSSSLLTSWEGSLDDVIILKEAMSQSAILDYITSKDHWALDSTLADPADEPLKHYWRFNENSGTTFVDSRGGLTGNLPSTSYWTIDRPYLGNGLTDTTIPARPTTVTTSGINADGFTASWSEATDNVFVQFYELQVSEQSNFASYSSFDTGRVRSHKVTNLLPGVNYYWRVRAFDAELNSSLYTTTQSLTTPVVGDNTPPTPPTNLTTSYVTHSEFRLTFTPSASTDVAGYKLDIATDSNFDHYLPSYRNKDIGNTTDLMIHGVSPLTSYYIRLRAYDNFENESLESTTRRVDTMPQPDITPPQVVTHFPPTGISSRSAILNWDEGVDDVGVTGYYVDVAQNESFTDIVSTLYHRWQNVDVGNITSIKIDGLFPETDYYWRVRAYDEAGNVSDYPDISEQFSFITSPSSLYEAGLMESEDYPNRAISSTDRSSINESTPNSEELFISSTNSVYLEYDLSAVIGSIASASLRFIPKLKAGNTLGFIKIRVRRGPISSVNPPQEIFYDIIANAEPIEIDITALVASETDVYSVEILSDGYVGYIDSGYPVSGYTDNPSAIPSVFILADPSTSTQPLEANFSTISQVRENLQPNPSFESNTNGWIGIGNGAITTTGNASDGSQSMQVIGSDINSGVGNTQTANSMPTVLPFEVYTASVDMSRLAGNAFFHIILEARDNLGSSPVEIGRTSVTISNFHATYSVSGVIPQGKNKLSVSVRAGVSGSYTFSLDNVHIERGAFPGASFNGNSFDARWKGAAHNSVSTVQGTRFKAESPFLGDANHNNSSIAFFRNARDTNDWFPVLESGVVDRVRNVYTYHIGPSYSRVNLIKNPSFEVDSYFWSGGERVDTHQYVGECSYFVLTGNNADYVPPIPKGVGNTKTVRAQVISPGGTVTLRVIGMQTATNGSQTIVNQQVFTTTKLMGVGDTWEDITLTFTLPAAYTQYSIRLSSTEDMYIDAVQANNAAYPLPYRDGTILDGVWEGIPHRSSTGLQINGNNTYNVRFQYTDPDGFFDAETTEILDTQTSFVVPEPPDNVTTISPMILSATTSQVFVRAPYSGDDNENNTCRIEFKRTDLSQWNEVRPTFIRSQKEVRATIPGLRHGTNYTIRATFSDPDGIYGYAGGIVQQTVTTNYEQEAVDSNIYIAFGGFTLMGRDDAKISVLAHDAFGFPDRRMQVQELPRQDGGIERQSPWGAKTIRMKGIISGNSRAELSDIRHELVRALAPSTQKLVIDTLSHKGRYYNATCSKLDINEEGSKNISYLGWDAEFTCADPFAYDLEEAVIQPFSAASGGVVSAPNTGDVMVYPEITIGTSSPYPVTLTVENTASGDRMTPKVTIVRNDALIIDANRRSLTKNGIEVDYLGGFIRFPVGENRLQFTAKATKGTPLLEVRVRWRHRYL